MNTLKMNKVLIALDYNPTAQKVAEVGYSIAKAMGADCMLIHILSTPIIYTSLNYDSIMGFSGFEALESYQSNSELLSKSAHQYLDKVKKHLGDSKIETSVNEGEFDLQIIEAATIYKADLIILGSHSQQWLERVFIGSTAEGIIQISKIPTVIVPTTIE
jgi:nucleotide-binding universal stress UspA family protein